MKTIVTPRLLWLLWFATLSLFVAVWLFPLSSTSTRSVGVLLFAILWLGLIALAWRARPFRFGLLAITALCFIFLALPSRHNPDTASLRLSYITALRRYNGVPYYWGGESPKGIDCSGLIRRGLIDSLFLQGLHTLDPGLVRRSIRLWWHDCTARELGEGHGFTTHLLETPSINALDQSRLLPGDLAVTTSGAHIMAYLGNKSWIEADPALGRVVTVPAPSRENQWFLAPMNIVRWKLLRQ